VERPVFWHAIYPDSPQNPVKPPGPLQIPTTPYTPATYPVQKSLHVNSLHLAKLDIEIRKRAAAIAALSLFRSRKIFISEIFHPKSLESIFCSHTPPATY
jgi:hypothetical protein